MKYQIKFVKGYEGLYEVDNEGNLFSLNYGRTGERRKIKPSINNHGYCQVMLCKDRQRKNYLVHRLVAEYPSLAEAERQTGINHQNISKCCLGKIKSIGGYRWKYK